LLIPIIHWACACAQRSIRPLAKSGNFSHKLTKARPLHLDIGQGAANIDRREPDAFIQAERRICTLGSELDCSGLKQINQRALNITATHANALLRG